MLDLLRQHRVDVVICMRSTTGPASWAPGELRRRRRTTPAGPDDRAAGTGDGNAWREFDREQSAVGRRAEFCSHATGTRRSGATTCVSTLPQGGTRARIPAAPRLARYSAELRCPIRDGTDAPARPRAPRRSVQ